ncbi:MAG: SURF1 family protein [Shewanella sp.]|uniref:SURF1 family protein n=1 Tax=Shewanella sp. TaxID=50422 RepID=UPI003F3E27D6
MPYPYLLLNKFTVLLLLLTVTVFSLLIKLGLWQLARGEEKATQLAQMAARQAQLPLSYPELLEKVAQKTPEDAYALTGYRLEIHASPAPSPIWLLDNQIYQGEVGYLAFQLLQIDAKQPWLLIELGFIGAGLVRHELPKIAPLRGQLHLQGRLYQKQINPLSQTLQAEMGELIRFQNLNIVQMEQLLGQAILPVVLQPETLPSLALPHPWQPFPLSAQKHQGYALQWFTMAAVFAGLMLWQGLKYHQRLKEQHPPEEAPTAQ